MMCRISLILPFVYVCIWTTSSSCPLYLIIHIDNTRTLKHTHVNGTVAQARFGDYVSRHGGIFFQEHRHTTYQ